MAKPHEARFHCGREAMWVSYPMWISHLLARSGYELSSAVESVGPWRRGLRWLMVLKFMAILAAAAVWEWHLVAECGHGFLRVFSSNGPGGSTGGPCSGAGLAVVVNVVVQAMIVIACSVGIVVGSFLIVAWCFSSFLCTWASWRRPSGTWWIVVLAVDFVLLACLAWILLKTNRDVLAGVATGLGLLNVLVFIVGWLGGRRPQP